MTSAFGGSTYGNNNDDIFKYRNNNMCSKWKETDVYNDLFTAKIYQNNDKNVMIKGSLNMDIKKLLKGSRIFLKYFGANSPTNGGSFTGSGLPFPNKEVAYENTDNTGILQVFGDVFSLNILKPNSYYINHGKTLIRPHINFTFIDGNERAVSNSYKIMLDDYIPYRSLSMRREDVLFYDVPNLPIRTQEQILRDSKYNINKKEHSNFWGTRPPN
jgi:hypothetical protein